MTTPAWTRREGLATNCQLYTFPWGNPREMQAGYESPFHTSLERPPTSVIVPFTTETPRAAENTKKKKYRISLCLCASVVSPQLVPPGRCALFLVGGEASAIFGAVDCGSDVLVTAAAGVFRDAMIEPGDLG